MDDYVHGYSEFEESRLFDQAGTLAELLHHDTFYPAGSTVLEAGCGVGAQSVILARKSPDARFTSVDVSRESVKKAELRARSVGIQNVSFQVADIFDLPFGEESFDHVFVCFVLEHLKNPLEALLQVKRVIRKGGSLTVIEGDHGSAYFHPGSREASRAIRCLIEVQEAMGGNSLIGRELYPLLTGAGFANAAVSARMVYVDASRPHLVEGFTKKTFIAMVEGVRKQALGMNLMDEKAWVKGIEDLYRTTAPDGVFCYTFFKGIALK